ncbi:MAG: TonB-dependent receptor, partial [Alphaproteobacteria bacterium]|nr:TonB-dependent receptor [Alphaproteobacteria bacterium]
MVEFRRGAASELTARQSWGMNAKGAHLATTAVLAAILCFAATQSEAQETGADAATASQARGATLDTITVTARKREESLQETPLAITAFSADQLTRRNLTNLSEIGAFVPNVTMNVGPSSSGAGNNIQIYIRGVGQTDFLFTTDPGVGIYVDGVYHPRTLGGVFDLLDLERVEILRGPQGTLFGKNAIGGAISLVSKKPTGDGTGWAEVTTGKFNRLDARASFDFAITDNLSSIVSISSKNRDGYGKRLEFGTDKVLDTTGDENVTAARIALRWEPSDTVTVDLSGDYTREREKSIPNTLLFFDDASTFGGLQGLWNGLVGIPNGLAMSSAFITGDPFTSYATGPNRNELDAYGAGLTIEWELHENLSFKSITAYRQMQAAFSSDTDNSPLQFTETDQDQEQNQISQEFQFSGTNFGDRLNWVVGAFYFDEYGRDENQVRLVSGLYDALEALPGPLNGSPLAMPTAPGGPGNPINVLLDLDFDILNEIDIKSYAAFTQGSLEVTDELSLTAGIRYTYETKDYTFAHLRLNSGVFILPPGGIDDNWGAATPMGSLDYQWADGFMTYASVSRGFKSGGFNGRPTTASQIESFDPEFVTAYEIGAKTDWFDQRLRLNVAGFFNNYTDIQFGSISADVNGNLVLRIQNAGDAEVKGFEVEMEAQPAPGLNIIGSVGYTDFKLTSVDPGLVEININSQQVKTPKWTAAVGAQYTWQVGDSSQISARGDWTYQGSTFQDVQNTPLI